MKFSKTKPFILIFTLTALALVSKFTSYEAKADAPIKVQTSVAVRSASLNSDKVIKVPDRSVQKTSSKTISLSRGGSGLDSAGPKAPEGSNDLVAYAYKFLGKPYVWGASGPKAFDCSGFTYYVFKAFGVSLPHNAASQFGNGQAVSKSNLAQGDLVFFNTYGSLSHVGIYIGGGRFIHASNSKTGVIVSTLSEGYYDSRYAGAKRILK